MRSSERMGVHQGERGLWIGRNASYRWVWWHKAAALFFVGGGCIEMKG
ncbi:MAG: hypothetical protein ACYS76_09120 [Planctomycetota bacterium]